MALGICDSAHAISTGTAVAGALHRCREEAMHEDKMFWVRVVSLILALLVTAACGTVPASVTPAESDAPRHVRVSEAYGKLPLYFEANKGQTDEQVRFPARGSRSTRRPQAYQAPLPGSRQARGRRPGRPRVAHGHRRDPPEEARCLPGGRGPPAGIAGGYVLEGARRVGFRVAAYDARRPLVIDP